MPTLSTRIEALIIAGLISVLLIDTIANLSYATQQKSVLDFDRPAASCVLSICSLV